MALQCPAIYNSTIPQSIVTVDTINLVRTDTSQRTVGTVVNLSCYTGRTLTNPSTQNELTTDAEKKYTCLNVGGVAQWDKTLPICAVPTTNTTNNTTLTQQELIVIGVVAAVCCLVLILVIVMLCACWYKRRRDRINKRPASDYSVNTGQFDGYKPYSMYSPFPGVYREGSVDRRPQYYSASLPRSATVLPESFPRPSQHSAYELQSRSAIIRTKPYVGYAGPRVYKSSSDTYEDYLAERNTGFYGGGRDNDGFRGEWNDRFDRKSFSDFNRSALDQGRDPFLWDRNN